VTDPILVHELDPGSGKQVEGRSRLEPVPGQEAPAHDSWVGREECAVIGRCCCRRRREVPAEPRADTFRLGVRQVVVGAIDGTPEQLSTRRWRLPSEPRKCPGVDQVALANVAPQASYDGE
jgi:hypothetical protein